MPQLPSIDDVSRVALQPSNTVAGRAVVSYGNATAPGQALTSLGNEIRQVAAQEQAKLDSARVEDATTQLRLRELELTVGKEGYVGVKGGDVLKRQLSTEFGDQYRRTAEDIAKGLTPGQRAAFDGRAKEGFVQFQTGILKHSLIESEKNRGAVFEASVKAEYEIVGKQADNQVAIDNSLARLDGRVREEAIAQGLTDPDGVLLAGIVKQSRGGLHSAVVDSLIAQDKTADATAYLAKVKASDDITPEQIKSLEARLKPLNDIAKGGEIGLIGFDKLRKGASNVEVELFIAEQTKGNEQQRQAASSEVQRLLVKQDLDERQVSGGYIKKALQNPGSIGAVIKAVYADPALAGDAARQVAIVKELQGLQDHNDARARQRRADTENKPAEQLRVSLAIGKLLGDPATFTKSEEQLYSHARELGQAGLHELLTIVRREKKEVGGFKLDQKILDDAAVAAVGGESAKADGRIAYKGYVQRKLNEWQVNNPGKKPSYDEELRIIRSGAIPFKEVGKVWGFNDEFKAYQNRTPDALPDAFIKANDKLSSGDKLKKWNTPTPEFAAKFKAAAKAQGRAPTDEAVSAAWRTDMENKYSQ